jgi:hypothetical protein
MKPPEGFFSTRTGSLSTSKLKYRKTILTGRFNQFWKSVKKQANTIGTATGAVKKVHGRELQANIDLMNAPKNTYRSSEGRQHERGTSLHKFF